MFFERSIDSYYVVIDRNVFFIEQITKYLKHSAVVIEHKIVIDHTAFKFCLWFISINNRGIEVEIRGGVISEFIIDDSESVRSLDIFRIDFVIFLKRFICLVIFSEFIVCKTRKLENWFISRALCEDFIRDDRCGFVIFAREE